MSPHVEIPERAHIVAHDAYDAAMSTASIFDCGCCDAIKAAAPIIVAAELRRLRDELKRSADPLGDEEAAGILYAAVTLQQRACELDPLAGHDSTEGKGKREQ